MSKLQSTLDQENLFKFSITSLAIFSLQLAAIRKPSCFKRSSYVISLFYINSKKTQDIF